MSRKIMFYDIDDTLVDGRNHQVPDSAAQAIRLSHEKGHLNFINTGRCRSFIQHVLRDLPIDGYCYACGAHIEYLGKVLFEHRVSREDIDFLREGLRKTGIQSIFQGADYCYFSEPAAKYLRELKGLPEEDHPENDLAGRECYPNLRRFLEKTYKPDYTAPIHLLCEEEMEVNKLVSFWTDPGAHDDFLELMKGRPYQYIENRNGFTEILPLHYTKASCMDYLLEYFDIPKEDCYVFGDSPNDLPMLTHVGTSVAMGNGYDAVKDISDYVTTDIDKDGIWNAMKHFGII